MRVLVVGAGPGGLYAALLLKKADPRRSVQVLERRPAGATYGWGVVFSDQTLGALQDADLASHKAIVDSFARWDAIDVHLEDAPRLRAHGHGFAGMCRRRLLTILQRRCADLGVEVCFRHPLEEPAQLRGHDLVIAADGLRSRVRQVHGEHFRPSFDTRTAKFVWYGTTLRPEAFTYVVRRTPHGLVQATCYPYRDDRSTFIIECSEATWSGLGLDRMDDAASRCLCETLFADVLDGHRLLSDRSRWSSFVTVRSERWHHENVVLLGDAAHTAHFSIGSGTKLAMEDAIALARALDQRPSLESALTYYEQARRPIVESMQEAARESLRWFERLDHHVGMEPPQFAFNFLTRSGRITYDDVRVRDGRFADSIDRWFASRARGVEADLLLAPPPLFNPLTVRGTTIPNRAVVVQVGRDHGVDGMPGPGHVGELADLARSGAGLVMTELVAVSPQARVTTADAGLYDEVQLLAWRRAVDAARAAAPAVIGIRLGHAGARGATRPRRNGLDRPLADGGWELIAASPERYSTLGARPRAMTRQDMDAVRDAFVGAALMGATAGFDVLELHCGHGYLLAGFISPLTNHRRDEYGGTLEHRLRFPLEVVAAVRRAWPPDRPLVVAFSASDWARGGLTEEDAVATAARLREAGADLIDVLAGQTVSGAHPPTYRGHYLAELTEVVRRGACVPTLARGGLVSSDDMNTVLAAGQADLCVMDPWPAPDSWRWVR